MLFRVNLDDTGNTAISKDEQASSTEISGLVSLRTIQLASFLTPAPRKDESSAQQTANKQPTIQVTCMTARNNLSSIALGCSDGSVITIDNKKGSTPQVWLRPGMPVKASGQQQQQQQQTLSPVEPITTINYRSQANIASLYITTASSVYLAYLSKTNINLQKISEEGCAPRCAVLCEGTSGSSASSQFGELVVASSLTMFFQADDRLSCYLLSEQKDAIWFCGCFLGIVSHDANMQRSSITIYDIRSKIIAFSLKLDQISHATVLTGGVGGVIYLVNLRGEVNVLTELSLRHKMMLLLKRDLYNVALALASQDPTDMKMIHDITMKYGDYLYNKGDYDAATLQYIETIGVVEPSLIISKFLFTQRINCLTTYLEALHDRITTSTEHTTLLLTCYTKLKDIYKLSTFLLNNRALRLQSCAVPYETTLAIEYLLLHCTAIETDAREGTRVASNITDIQQILGHDPGQQQQLLNNSKEKIYNMVSYYNTIHLYLKCSFPYHALFLSMLYGAHHCVVMILIQLQRYDEVINYLYTLPAHIVLYLLHMHGIKIIRNQKKAVTELCIKLVCGWKQRVDIVHTLVIQFDTNEDNTTRSTTEPQAVFSSEHISECDLDAPVQSSSASPSQTRYRGLDDVSGHTADPLSDEPGGGAHRRSIGNAGRPKGTVTNVMKLQIRIGTDGRIILLNCVGLGTNHRATTASMDDAATNESSVLLASSLIHTKLVYQQNSIEESLLKLRKQLMETQQAVHSAETTQSSTQGGETLTLNDFDTPIASTQEQQKLFSLTQQISKLERKLKELNQALIPEHLVVSPSDLTAVFSDHAEELQMFLESITSHATVLQQKQQNSSIAAGNKGAVSAIPVGPDGEPIFAKKNESQVILLNTQISTTTAFDSTNSSASHTTSSIATPSAEHGGADGASLSSGPGAGQQLVPVVLQTHFMCGSQLWTSLVELYAQMIKTISSVSHAQALSAAGSTTQEQHGQTTDGEEVSLQTDSNAMGEAQLRLLSHEQRQKMMADLENKVNTLIKKNFDSFDHASILVVLESYDLDLPLSFVYSRTRQFHSLLTLHLNKGDWARARSVCLAFSQHEPSLWLFLLIKVVEHYDSQGSFAAPQGTAGPSRLPPNALTSSSAPAGQTKPNDLLYECIEHIQTHSLLSPLEIISILSSNPKITLAPIRNYLLQVLTQFQNGNQDYMKETLLYQTDAQTLRQDLQDLRHKPVRFQSIDCSHCSLPLTIPAVHFLCKHSFHVSCANEIDVGAAHSAGHPARQGGGATSQYECPICAQEHKKLQLLTQSMKNTSMTHEKFYKRLDEAREPFNVIGDFIAKGVFNNADQERD